MKTDLILDFTITDLSTFMGYVKKIPAYLIKHKGQYLVEGVTPEVIEGKWNPTTIVVLEFESQQNANHFLIDPEVKQLFEIRHKSSTSNLIKVTGGSWRDEWVSNA